MYQLAEELKSVLTFESSPFLVATSKTGSDVVGGISILPSYTVGESQPPIHRKLVFKSIMGTMLGNDDDNNDSQCQVQAIHQSFPSTLAGCCCQLYQHSEIPAFQFDTPSPDDVARMNAEQKRIKLLKKRQERAQQQKRKQLERSKKQEEEQKRLDRKSSTKQKSKKKLERERKEEERRFKKEQRKQRNQGK